MLAVDLLSKLNPSLLTRWNCHLIGGNSEPVYIPAADGKPAEIRFTRDFTRSALHELAHWTIAGDERRRLVDYGYWYCPDGRNALEQEQFFLVEVKPQAVEKAFSEACGIRFEVSCDNLAGDKGDSVRFTQAVSRQLEDFRSRGFPVRAGELLELLKKIN